MICFGSSRNSDLLLLGGLHRFLDTADRRSGFASLSCTTRVATAVLTVVLHNDVERLIKFGRHVDGVIFVELWSEEGDAKFKNAASSPCRNDR